MQQSRAKQAAELVGGVVGMTAIIVALVVWGEHCKKQETGEARTVAAELLKSPDPAKRLEGARKLRELSLAPEAKPLLMYLVTQDPDPDVRYEAADSLLWMAGPHDAAAAVAAKGKPYTPFLDPAEHEAVMRVWGPRHPPK